jgi:hypothetical protein
MATQGGQGTLVAFSAHWCGHRVAGQIHGFLSSFSCFCLICEAGDIEATLCMVTGLSGTQRHKWL